MGMTKVGSITVLLCTSPLKVLKVLTKCPKTPWRCDYVAEAVNKTASFYTSDYDGVEIQVDGDDLAVSLRINNDEYAGGPDGLESFINDLIAWDDEKDKIVEAIIEDLTEAGYIGGEGRTKSLDTVAFLERTLKNFDEVEFEDGEINSYAKIKVQLPRVPKLIQDVSRQMGTNNNPGPLHYLKDNITGPARNRDETLLDFMQKIVTARLKRWTSQTKV